MIVPVNFLWAQLDGPQITTIAGALSDFWKKLFDDKLSYINSLSIETANDAHLTLLGNLAGLVRPLISEADTNYFFFTDVVEHDYDRGFADLDDPTTGGRLSGANTGQGATYVPLNSEHYRALLKAFVSGESQGELGSLALLDDICFELSKIDIPNVTPFYRFAFEDGTHDQRAPGDLYIDMGRMNQWKNPTHIYAVLKGLARTVYAPLPQVFISLTGELVAQQQAAISTEN